MTAMNHKKHRVLFLASSLARGGAERQLVAVARGLNTAGFVVDLAVLYGGGELEAELRDEGVKLHSLGQRRRTRFLMPFLRLYRLMRRDPPDVIHSYLPVANLLALAAGALVKTKVVWGLRASNVDFSHYGLVSDSLFRLECRLAKQADLAIANSHAGKQHYVAHGVPSQLIRVVPNGVDIEHFKPDPDADALREEWNVGSRPVIGIVGRADPMKDYDTFFRAAAQYIENYGPAFFVAVGRAVPQKCREIIDEIGDHHLAPSTILIDETSQLPAIYSAFDVFTSSSAFGEGFSNVVAESMACGTPCVVTDVGDSASIVAEYGEVVPPRDPKAMAAAWRTLLDRMQVDSALPAKSRAHISEHFALPFLAERTAACLTEIL